MHPIRFIHAADLHLDAAFSGLSRDIPAEFAERLRTATFTAFRRLLDLCERESPDFLLLAGDVYNQEDASVSAQLALRDGFRRLESLSIPVFLVHGNHDPLASRLRSVRWPGNVTVFGELPDAVPVFRKGEETPLAIIHGASHASGRETGTSPRSSGARRRAAFTWGCCTPRPAMPMEWPGTRRSRKRI